VIVIDNGSTDGSPEMVSNDFPQVILLKNLENKGFATGNNQGIAIAKGRYMLLLNSDTIILDSALSKAVAFADVHSETAVVGCRVLNPDRTIQPTCFMFPSLLNMFLSSIYLYKLFPKSRFFGRERMTWWSRRDACEVDVTTGCFMLVRREAIEQVGVMDERFFMYGEETDWCYRFKKNGWKVVFVPVDGIIHLGGQSTRQIQREMLVQQRISILQFIRKHQGSLKYRLSCFLITFSLIIRIPGWSFIALFNRKKRRDSINRIKAYMACIGKSISMACSF
jgi:GT2 family glycosyltransferase